MKPHWTAALLLAGCITETGNPEFTASMGVRARTSAPTEVSIDGSGTGIAVDSAWVSIDDAKFVLGEACDTPREVEYEAPTPLIVDLVGNEALVEFPLAESDYCRVRVRLDDADGVPDGAPADLAESTVVITGTRPDGAAFTLVSDGSFELDVRSRGEPFPLDETREALLLAFDVAGWLTGIGLETATVGDDGAVRVDAASNAGVLAAFEANLAATLALYEDLDADGQLGDAEDDDPLAESGG